MILLGSTCTWKIVYAGAKIVNTHQYKASRRQSTHQGGHGPDGGATQLHLGTVRPYLGAHQCGQTPLWGAHRDTSTKSSVIHLTCSI